MVQKQAAYNRDPAGNAFADDDPLAELARLVGYDAPVARRIEPQVSTSHDDGDRAGYGAPHQPVDLHNELLHDLDTYVDDRQAAPVRTAPSIEPQDQDIGSDASLADELLWSMSEVAVEPQKARPGGADPTGGYGSHRLPLANFNPVRAVPQHQEDPPMQRQEPVAPTPAPSMYEPSSVYGRAAYDAPVSAQPAPSRQVEPDFDFDTAPAQRAPDASFAIEPERRAAAPVVQEPVFEQAPAPVQTLRREAPNFFDDLSYQEKENPAVQQSARPQEPVVEQTAEDDFFAGDLELDLSEIELDLSEFAPEPAVVREEPRAVRREPELPIAQREAPVQPVYQAQALPQATPQASRPDSQRERPAETEALTDDIPPLPFDAAEISDQDDQLEVISHLDVPDLPPVDEDKPATYTPEYDFDIDSELANLLDKTAAQRSGQQPAPALAAAPSSAAVPPIAEQVRNMPSDDFDVFEKALEEDFRRSLDTQYSFGAKQAGPVVEDLDDGDYEVEEERSSSRRWIAIAAAAAVVLVAGGGVFAWMKSSGSVALGGGEPKIVMADKDPVKVVPANPGGKSVPNQNKAVYDRVSGSASDQPSQKSLISSGEEPMDVAQRTLGPDNLPMDDEAGADVANSNADANAANAGGAQPAGAAGDKQSLAPRRVKTMIVRPDGSLVAQDDGAAAPVGSTTQTGNTQQTASVKQPSTSAATPPTGQSVDDLLASGAAQSAGAQADQPAAAQDTTGVPAPNMPVPMTRPTQTASAGAAPAKLAPPAAQAPATPAAAASTTPAAASGDYLIQISSLPTEADAQKSYKNLSAKFGSVIGGRGMDIKAADVPGKGTYYRVRIPAGSKEAAVSLCERYRTAGGSCMVVR